MRHLNYQHLLYFWTTAREGNLTVASRRLRLSPSTVSAQIRILEDQLGHPLFERTGRRLVLTERGRLVARFADQIFSLGEQLLDAVERPELDVPRWVRVGVESHLPRLVAANLLRAVVGLGRANRLVVTAGLPDELARLLVEGRLDVVITDVPVATADHGLLSHRLGECGVVWVGLPALVEPLRPRFPESLDGAPVLLPDRLASLRGDLEDWFSALDVRPRVVAEIGDSALIKALAADGAGLCPVPELVMDRVGRQYGVTELGMAVGVRQRFYLLADAAHAELWREIVRSTEANESS